VLLDRCLARLADAVADATGRDLRDEPGAGAAGGVGFAALAVLGAQLRPGIDLLLDLLGFDRLVAGADLVVVGEGSLDGQSLRGKAPVGVARRARAAGVASVVAVCGRRDLDDAALQQAGIDAAHALTDLEPDPDRCMTEAGSLLERLAQRIAAEHCRPRTEGRRGRAAAPRAHQEATTRAGPPDLLERDEADHDRRARGWEAVEVGEVLQAVAVGAGEQEVGVEGRGHARVDAERVDAQAADAPVVSSHSQVSAPKPGKCSVPAASAPRYASGSPILLPTRSP
jgi:hypothetical protein